MLFRLSTVSVAAIVLALSIAAAGSGVMESKAEAIGADGPPPPLGFEKQRPHALSFGCIVSPSTVIAGDPIKVTGSPVGQNTHKESTYTWEVSGGKVIGKDETISISTTGLSPGNYLVAGHLSQGKRTDENASCAEIFSVLAPPPPTVSCAANPVSVKPDGWSMITATVSGGLHTHLRYSYASSAGEISGSNSVATLNTLHAPPGPITVECTVRDDLGLTATSTAVVYVHSTPSPVAEHRTLCGLNFDRDAKSPVRVDTDARACLDDVAWTLKHQPAAQITITGERSPDESIGQAWARAANARDYLTKEKGIDPARIEMLAGSLQTRSVEMELVPDGAAIRTSDHSGDAAASRPRILFIPDAASDTRSTQIIETAPATSPIAHPRYLGPGVAGPRRTANSLVLPPLSATIKAAGKPRDKSHPAKQDAAAKRAADHAPASPATLPGDSNTNAPKP